MEDLKKLKKKIISSTSKCIREFNMIQKGDHIMVCISGGKDSYTMLDMFIHFQNMETYHLRLQWLTWTKSNLDSQKWFF